VLAPGSAGALAAFEARSAATQERAITITELPGLPPDQLPAVHGALDSSLAQRGLVLDGCRALAALPDGDPAIPAWTGALAPLLASPAAPAYQTAFGSCARAVPPSLRAELAGLADQGAAIPAAQLGRLEYLLGFDHGAADALALVSRIATSAPSIRHRDLALDALPDVAALLHEVPLDPAAQRRIVCEAFLIGEASPAWAAFQAAAEPWDELSDEAAAALGDPAACSR
jgi:hypothetical protein